MFPSITRRPLTRRRLSTAALLLSVALAACSKGGPVGQGIAPVALTVFAGDANTLTITPGSVRVFQCFTGSLAAAMSFSDGSAGNFTNRVTWTSSEPDVIAVSNAQVGNSTLGDIPKFDGSGFYPPGTLVVRGGGTATIRADFSSFHVETAVSIGQPTRFAVKAVLDALPRVVTNYTMGIGTTQQFQATATVDGMERNASNFVEWRVGNPAVGSASSTGLLTAQGRGDTTYTAHLALCDQDAPIDLHVANISSIYTTLEFGTQPVLIGNRERVHVMAALDDGTGPQDVSAQATITSQNTSVITVYGGLAGSGGNLLVPVVAGTGTIQASLLNLYTAPDIAATVASATLMDFAIVPPAAGSDGNCQFDIIRAGSAETCPYTAIGTFDNGQVQDVTRMMTWAILTPSLGAISTAVPTAGFLTASNSATAVGQTQITATPPATTSLLPVARMVTMDSISNPASH